MSKELEKLSLKEKWDNFLDFVDAPTKARLLDCDCKEGLEQYRYLRTEIEDALKDYERRLELAKEYEDVNNVAKRLKAFEIIKEKIVDVWLLIHIFFNGDKVELYNELHKIEHDNLTQEEYELLKEVLL